jgi:hypothetical protein
MRIVWLVSSIGESGSEFIRSWVEEDGYGEVAGDFLEGYCDGLSKIEGNGDEEERFFKKVREGNENEEILLKEHLKTIQCLMSFYQSQGNNLTFNQQSNVSGGGIGNISHMNSQSSSEGENVSQSTLTTSTSEKGSSAVGSPPKRSESPGGLGKMADKFRNGVEKKKFWKKGLNGRDGNNKKTKGTRRNGKKEDLNGSHSGSGRSSNEIEQEVPEEISWSFEKTINSLIFLITKLPISNSNPSTSSPLSLIQVYILNALMNFPISSYPEGWIDPIYNSPGSLSPFIEKVIEILKIQSRWFFQGIENERDWDWEGLVGKKFEDLDLTLIGVIMLLRRMTGGNEVVKEAVKREVFPFNL